MKKTIFTIAITMIVGGIIITGCQSSETKVENAQEKVQFAKDKLNEANQELDQATKDSIQQYRKENLQKLNAHEKSIADFKSRIATKKKENRAEYEKELLRIEEKNTDLKKRLDEYKEEGRDRWDIFKSEFSREMDQLGEDFKKLTTKK
jgi:hypothetical protein